ncbi:MAG: M56 family metallopeptidase [Eisenbergiella sp.]
MNTMMQGLLSASLSGSLMVLVFLALRYLLNGHISRTGCYYIWLLILLRFLIPYSPIPGIAGYTAERIRQAAGRQQTAETGTQDSVPVMETAGGKVRKLPGLQGLMCRKWMWKRTREGRQPAEQQMHMRRRRRKERHLPGCPL